MKLFARFKQGVAPYGDAFVVVIAIAVAAGIGKSGGSAWWLLIPAALIGYVIANACARAEAARDRHYAELLLAVLRDGNDVSWTIEHIDRPPPSDKANGSAA